eukprot:jgi/Hompol1/3905/HPOL_006862-RA
MATLRTIYEDTPEARAGPASAVAGAPLPQQSHQPQQQQVAAVQQDLLQRQASGRTHLSTGSSERRQARPNVPGRSYALVEDQGVRTNLGHTKLVMALLSEWWIISLLFMVGGTFAATFYVPQFYVDDVIWNTGCYWKL